MNTETELPTRKTKIISLQCCACESIAEKLQLTPCGHHFCDVCVAIIAETQSNVVEDETQDKSTNHSEVLQLQVICPEVGCEEKFTLNELKPYERGTIFVLCPRGCGTKIGHNDVKQHLKDGCCKQQMSQQQENCNSGPVQDDLLCCQKKIQSAQTTSQSQSDNNNHGKCRFSEVEHAVEELGNEISTLKSFLKVNMIKNEFVEEKLAQFTQERMKNEVELLEKLKLQDERLKQMESLKPSPSKKLVWEITNFTHTFTTSSYKYSNHFFSRGYKLCLKLKKCHEFYGIFLCIMKGPWDELLTWPCKYEATISLLNQNNGQCLVNKIFSFEKKGREEKEEEDDEAGWEDEEEEEIIEEYEEIEEIIEEIEEIIEEYEEIEEIEEEEEEDDDEDEYEKWEGNDKNESNEEAENDEYVFRKPEDEMNIGWGFRKFITISNLHTNYLLDDTAMITFEII